MFTGIIEEIGKVSDLKTQGKNLDIYIEAKLSSALKVDQSVTHNGACLTVVEQNENSYKVTAIDETLKRTNLSKLQIDDPINLERGMKLGARLDGHIVQGHIDQIGVCTNIREQDGSYLMTFSYAGAAQHITIEKGSITINGVSLTIVESTAGQFSVAIIPYTFEHTNFKELQSGDTVNLEFDVIGKYVKGLMNTP